MVRGIQGLPGFDQFQIDGQPLGKDGLLRILRYVDASEDGLISYLEFLAAFEICTPASGRTSRGIERHDQIIRPQRGVDIEA